MTEIHLSIVQNLNEKNGTESGEGRDGVQGPRNANALRQQLWRHRQSFQQQHVPEVLQHRIGRRHRHFIIVVNGDCLRQ
ncbi:hypothetical protein ACFX2K_019878 [Malus domestica]